MSRRTLRIRKLVKKALLQVYRIGLRLGVSVGPATPYSSVVDINELRRTRQSWARKSELPGIVVDLESQLARLRQVCDPFQPEVASGELYRRALGMNLGQGYGPVDFAAWYACVRYFKPSRIVEVAGGVSSLATVEAAQTNELEGGTGARIVCVEPFPKPGLTELAGIDLIQEPVQSIPMEVFLDLRRDDLLFIDSAHTVKPGGDVNHLILEVLPRLAPGVVVHFDDISFPFDYELDALDSFYHWGESSLLRAYLINNANVEILFSLRHLLADKREQLVDVFPQWELGTIPPDGLFGADHRPFDYPPGIRPEAFYMRIV